MSDCPIYGHLDISFFQDSVKERYRLEPVFAYNKIQHELNKELNSRYILMYGWRVFQYFIFKDTGFRIYLVRNKLNNFVSLIVESPEDTKYAVKKHVLIYKSERTPSKATVESLVKDFFKIMSGGGYECVCPKARSV